jgi:hypothetical protein
MADIGDIIGQGLADTESQRSEYGDPSTDFDIPDFQSVTIYHEIVNFKIDQIDIGSNNPTIFVLNTPTNSNVGSMNLGGYDNSFFIFDETFDTITYLETGSTTAQWSTVGSLVY